MPPRPRVLTREESKAITRGRLLEAGRRLLSEQGSKGLSASAVARAAGVAQPTFYVHFRDKAELLDTLAEDQIGRLRVRLSAARQRFLEHRGDDSLREAFRLPLETWLAVPDLLQLHLREVHQAESPFGRRSRKLRDEIAKDLIDDLVRFGLSAETALERQRLRMTADAILAQTDALALGLIEGRYDSVETAVDVLMRFALSAVSNP